MDDQHISEISALLVVDRQGLIQAIGNNITKMIGWSPSDLVGKPITDFLLPEIIPKTNSIINKFATDREELEGKTALVSVLASDGYYCPIKVTAYMLDDVTRAIIIVSSDEMTEHRL